MEKLDHLVRLGVNAVQIMPLMEFAGDLSWGYNPAHIFAVESTYGGPDAFKTFVREAHKRGIAVILDVVYNHFGPSDLDLWRFDGWSENDKGGIYFYNDDRCQTPWGDTRPDYGREEVRRFIHDNAMSWLNDYHLDGLRFDMTPYIRSVHGSGHDLPEGWDLMRWINLSLREQFPERISIAEDMQQDPRISAVGDDGAAFHAQWDGAFVHPVRQVVIAADDDDRSIQALCAALEARYNDDAFQRVVYTESHDEVANGRARVPYEVDPEDPTGWYAQKRSTLGAALVFTAPGIPMIFQGQEFLQGEWFRDDVPLDWDQNTDFGGHRPSLPRPDPAAPEHRRGLPRAHRSAPQRAARQRPGQRDRLPPLGRRRPRRRRRRRGQPQQPDARRLHRRHPRSGALEPAAEQRRHRLQPGLRGHPQRRPRGGRGGVRRPACPGHPVDRSLHGRSSTAAAEARPRPSGGGAATPPLPGQRHQECTHERADDAAGAQLERRHR